jgi:hypothetical protein
MSCLNSDISDGTVSLLLEVVECNLASSGIIYFTQKCGLPLLMKVLSICVMVSWNVVLLKRLVNCFLHNEIVHSQFKLSLNYKSKIYYYSKEKKVRNFQDLTLIITHCWLPLSIYVHMFTNVCVWAERGTTYSKTNSCQRLLGLITLVDIKFSPIQL